MLNPYGVHMGVTVQTHFGRKARKGSEPILLSGGYTFEGPSYREERVFLPLVIWARARGIQGPISQPASYSGSRVWLCSCLSLPGRLIALGKKEEGRNSSWC